MSIQLVRPNSIFRESYLAAWDEMQTDSDLSAWVYLGDSAPRDVPRKNFDAYVETILGREYNPPPGFVTDTVYWALDGSEVVGRISLRHELNDFLRTVGGHIGYIVRPTFRQRGIATEMLRQILQTPEARSVRKILLTCDDGNLASEKSILKNGGVFDCLVDVGSHRPKKKHFWITLNS